MATENIFDFRFAIVDCPEAENFVPRLLCAKISNFHKTDGPKQLMLIKNLKSQIKNPKT